MGSVSISGGPILIAVMGQTASGKTALAENLATALDAQLVNADAFQSYRGMDVGTAKPDDRARYRLLDVKDPRETYGVGEYCVRAAKELGSLHDEGRSAVVVGGTGQYIRALFEAYRDLMPDPDPDLRTRFTKRLAEEGLAALVAELWAIAPETASRTDLANPIRVTRALERLADSRLPVSFEVPYKRTLKVSVFADAAAVNERIAHRARRMMHNGFVEEVQRLRSEGYGPDDPGFRAIGYRTILSLIDGDLGTGEAERAIVAETVAYAKRQRTWLRSEPRLDTAVLNGPLGFQQALTAVRDAFLES